MAFHQLAAQTRATILMVVALFMFTLMGVSFFIRLSAAGLPVIEVVFFRNGAVWRSCCCCGTLIHAAG